MGTHLLRRRDTLQIRQILREHGCARLCSAAAGTMEQRLDDLSVIAQHLSRRFIDGCCDFSVIHIIGSIPQLPHIRIAAPRLTMPCIGTDISPTAAPAAQQFTQRVGTGGHRLRRQCILCKSSRHFRRHHTQQILLHIHLLQSCRGIDLQHHTLRRRYIVQEPCTILLFYPHTAGQQQHQHQRRHQIFSFSLQARGANISSHIHISMTVRQKICRCLFYCGGHHSKI